MKKITKENIADFIKYYHAFHDSYIKSINYDINNSKIELLIDVYWSGEPTLRKDNTYDTNKSKIKIIFDNIIKCNIKERESWEYIDEAFIKYIIQDNNGLLSFELDNYAPSISIVCSSIEYEEINEKW